MATLTNERGSIGTASISLTRRMNHMVEQFRGLAHSSGGPAVGSFAGSGVSKGSDDGGGSVGVGGVGVGDGSGGGSGGVGDGSGGVGVGVGGVVTRDELAKVLSRGRVLTMLSQRQGPVASTAASLLKLGVTELMFDAAELRVGVRGAHAMLADDPAAQSLLAAPGGRIAGGTTQIQRNLIGERLLGLPGEPRP